VRFGWQQRTLRSLAIMLAYVRGTTTETGLEVRASVTRKTYKTKIKISDQEMKGLNLERHKTCPKWNYTIRPGPLSLQAAS